VRWYHVNVKISLFLDLQPYRNTTARWKRHSEIHRQLARDPTRPLRISSCARDIQAGMLILPGDSSYLERTAALARHMRQKELLERFLVERVKVVLNHQHSVPSYPI
jgi:hypothetical protein